MKKSKIKPQVGAKCIYIHDGNLMHGTIDSVRDIPGTEVKDIHLKESNIQMHSNRVFIIHDGRGDE